jgi:site-specific recombinase XerD
MELLPDMYAPGTIAHYQTLKRYLKEFLIDSDLGKMRIDEWRRKHFVQFEQFLLTKPNDFLKRPISRATSNKYISKLKVIFNTALANEIITVDPTKGFKMERVSGTREYLTADQVHAIETNQLGDNKSLDKVRWIFLFSVYSGLRFSDAMNLKRSNIIMESDGNFYIDVVQKKTQKPLYRPLLGKAIQIYKKFIEEDPESLFVLPRISNQKTNAYLKVIADLCGIKKTLHHHLARHTFATTILLDSGIDLKAACFFMGHSSVRTTEVYAKITKNRAIDVVNQLNKNLV